MAQKSHALSLEMDWLKSHLTLSVELLFPRPLTHMLAAVVCYVSDVRVDFSTLHSVNKVFIDCLSVFLEIWLFVAALILEAFWMN